jgi:ribosomal protein L34
MQRTRACISQIFHENELNLNNLLLNLDTHPVVMIFETGRGGAIILYRIEIHSSRRFGFVNRTRSINTSNGRTKINRRRQQWSNHQYQCHTRGK